MADKDFPIDLGEQGIEDEEQQQDASKNKEEETIVDAPIISGSVMKTQMQQQEPEIYEAPIIAQESHISLRGNSRNLASNSDVGLEPTASMSNIPKFSSATTNSSSSATLNSSIVGRPISYRPASEDHRRLSVSTNAAQIVNTNGYYTDIELAQPTNSSRMSISVADVSRKSTKHSDAVLAAMLQEEELNRVVAETQNTSNRGPQYGTGVTLKKVRELGPNPRAMLRAGSSFAAWQLRKEKYGYCFGEAKHARFCMTMMFVCSVMFFVEAAVSNFQFLPIQVNPMFGPSVEVMIQLGAKKTELILAPSNEYYRLFAPMFLHGGLIHLLVNMIGLYNIGFGLEYEYGTAKIAYIYLSSGFMGVLISCIFNPATVGVGASGAIFGLFGGAWADLIQNWSIYKQQQIAKKTLASLIFATILNLGLGLLPLLDNFAHIGGFLNGILTGLTVLVQDRFTRYGELKKKKDYQACLQIFALLLTPIFMIIALALLFSEINVGETCKFCQLLDCIPTPFWECDACANNNLNAVDRQDERLLQFNCPGKSEITLTPYNETDVVDIQFAIAKCRELCL